MEESPVSRSFEASPAAVGRDRDPFEEEEFSDDEQSEEEGQEYQEDQEVPRVLFGGEKEENLQNTLSINEDEMLY
jgi:hypothetical protein